MAGALGEAQQHAIGVSLHQHGHNLYDEALGTDRPLASDAWPTNMALITRMQGLIAGAAMVILDAAQLSGRIDAGDRLTPAIAEAAVPGATSPSAGAT